MNKLFQHLLTIILVLSTTILFAQEIDMKLFEGMSIRNIGPAGMSGRVTAIDVDLSNPQHIFIGTASGGVWKSENGGTTWEPLFDNQPTLSIGALKINQNNPSEIWVGTGEGNPRNSHNSGAGVFKSIDGGKTWKYMGLKETKLIHRIIINENNPNTVLIGAMGSAWGKSDHRGVYKTTDGGENWKKVLYNNNETGIADMVVDPNNPNKIIVAMWEFGRKPWTFNSGGKGSGLYVSYDGGDNWKKKTDEDGLPKGDLGRMGIAFAPSNPNIVYALVEAKKNGLYKSTDGGEKWSLVSTKNIGNRPFYYAELYVDPLNENRIYNLWSYVSKSEDGGKTFETIMDYGNNVHPDHHAFWIHPEDPSYLIDGNDGGLNISRDRGETWTFASNIPVGQFYHVNVDDDFPYNVYGGMQDNGSWVGPGFVLKRGGIRNYDWQELYFGDGFDVAAQPSNNRYGYAMSQGGNIGRWDKVTGRTQFVKPVHPEGKDLRFHWNAALAQDPFSDCGVYYGSQYVHKSDDCGDSWKIISDDLTTNDTLKQRQFESGGLTIDDTEAENHTTILCIAPSPVDKDVIWVGTDDGNLQLSKDGGKSWTNLNSRLRGVPSKAWIPQIEVSTRNAGEAFVVVNNYRQNDWSAHTYHTADFGKSFTRIVDDSDVGGFVNTIVQDPQEENLLFLGTDVGLYFSINKGQKWTKWNEDFPSVQVRDMKIQKATGDLVIGTFGRAIWVLDDIGPLRELAASGNSILNKDFCVFDSPDAYLTSTRSYDGIRFIAQGEFVGDNRFTSGVINIWNGKEKKKEVKASKTDKKKGKKKDEKKGDKDAKKKDKKKSGKLKFTVFSEAGDTIRRFSRKVEDPGLNRVRWGLQSDGVRYPSRDEPKNDADPARGNRVAPGKYKVVVQKGDQRDSTWITVLSDPRIEMDNNEVGKAKIQKEYADMIENTSTAFKKIMKAYKSIDLVETMMVNLPDSTQSEIKEWNKEERKALAEIEGLYMMEKDLKGIQRDPGKLSTKLWRANYYLNSAWGMPGANAMNAYNNTKSQAEEVVQKVNTYFEGPWKTYQEKVKGVEFKIFED